MASRHLLGRMSSGTDGSDEVTHLAGVGYLGASGLNLVADRWQSDSLPARGLVVLLHGGGQTRHSWQTTGRDLASVGWVTVAVDARGHGDSDWAPDGDYGVEVLVEDLAAVVHELGRPPVLVGASMGGMTSLIACGRWSDFARALVLVDIVPRMDPTGVKEIGAFMRDGLGGFSSLEEAAEVVVAYNPNRPKPPTPDGLRRNLRFRDGRWHWHWDPAFLNIRDEPTRSEDPSPRTPYLRAREAARRLQIPTLVVRGQRSKVVTDAGLEEMRRLVPHAEFLEVVGAGHMVAGDSNDVFAAGLLSFLDRHLAPEGRHGG